MKETYKSRVYTDRPAYADFYAPAKFQAIQFVQKLIDGATGLKPEEKQSYIVSKHLQGVTV